MDHGVMGRARMKHVARPATNVFVRRLVRTYVGDRLIYPARVVRPATEQLGNVAVLLRAA